MKSFHKTIHYGQAALLSLLLSAFVFIVEPTQTYLGSPDLFGYSYGLLLGEGLIGCLAVGALLFLALAGLELLIGRVAPALALALLCCLYLETGILSAGLPALNGVGGFFNLLRGGLDALAWMSVFVVFFLMRTFVSRNFTWFLLSLGVLILASIFDSGSGSGMGSHAPGKNGFCPCYDVVKNIQFSKQRNVLVYILDMTPSSI